MHQAASAGRAAACQALLAGGARANALDETRETPLHKAMFAPCAQAVETLGHWGADFFALSRDGRPAEKIRGATQEALRGLRAAKAVREKLSAAQTVA